MRVICIHGFACLCSMPALLCVAPLLTLISPLCAAGPHLREVFSFGGSGAWADRGRGASRNGTGSCSCWAARCTQSMGLKING